MPDYAQLLDARRRHGRRPRSADAWTGAAIDASGQVTALRGLIDWGSPAFDAGLEHERRLDLGRRQAVFSGRC